MVSLPPGETPSMASWQTRWIGNQPLCQLAIEGVSPYGQLAEGLVAYPTSLVLRKVPGFNVLHAQPLVSISSPPNNSIVAMGGAQTIDINFAVAEGAPISVSL